MSMQLLSLRGQRSEVLALVHQRQPSELFVDRFPTLDPPAETGTALNFEGRPRPAPGARVAHCRNGVEPGG